MWPSIVYILLILVSVTSVNSSKLLPLRYNGASISMKCHNDAAYSSTEINKYGKKGCITQSRSKSCSFRGCIPLAVNTGLEPYNEGKYTTDQGNLFLSFIKQKKVTGESSISCGKRLRYFFLWNSNIFYNSVNIRHKRD